MQVNFNQSGQPGFSGKFSNETIKKAQNFLTSKELQRVKSFRAGSRYTKISIKTDSFEPVRLQNGSVVIPKQTYAEFTNSRSKNSPSSRIKLADSELPLNIETFKKITEEFVEHGEKLMNMYKK